MIATTKELTLATEGNSDVHDLTAKVEKIVSEAGILEGLATVFVPGSTASLTTIEFESGAVADLHEAVRRLIPENQPYRHDSRWGDGNGFAHVRAAVLGPSLTVPISAGKLQLGTWQQIVLLDHDNRPRRRKVLVQLLGA